MVENLINGLSAHLQGSVSLSFLAVYLGGVLISFTPCVYPVIPITVALHRRPRGRLEGQGIRPLADLCDRHGRHLHDPRRGRRAFRNALRPDPEQPLDLFPDREPLRSHGVVDARRLFLHRPDARLRDAGAVPEADRGGSPAVFWWGRLRAWSWVPARRRPSPSSSATRQRGRIWFSPRA